MRTWPTLAPAASLWVAALVAACAAGPDLSPVTEPPSATSSSTLATRPDWLTLELRYSPRHSLGRRRLDVLTTNGSGEEMVIRSIALRADHFIHLPPEEKNSHIPPGTTVAVKTDFGEVESCHGTEGPRGLVSMEFSLGDSPTLGYLMEIDPEPLDRILEIECQERALREALNVAFAEEWTVEGQSVRTELILTPRSEYEVMVEAVAGMILFGMTPLQSTGPPLAVLDSAPVSLPVELSLIRCDVHAVSQAPDGYAFRVWAGVGGGEPFALTVLPHDRLQAQLEDLVVSCLGVGGSSEDSRP